MRTALAVFLAGSLGCTAVDPSGSRVIGVVGPGVPETAVIAAPDTVEVGQRFLAIVNTFGSSGCTTPDGVALRQDAASASIIPYDVITSAEGTACTRDWAPRPHPVELSFTRSGDARIVVHGVHVGGTVPGRTLVTVTRDIRVLPSIARASGTAAAREGATIE